MKCKSSTSRPSLSVVLPATIVALLLASCSVDLGLGGDTTSRTERVTIPAAGITTLDLTTENEMVTVTSGSDDELDIVTTAHESRRGDADVSVVSDGDTVAVRGECDNSFWRQCKVDLHVAVPAETAVIVVTHSGRVMLDSLAGPIDVETNNGAVDAVSIGVPMVNARSDKGAIQLHFVSAPDMIDVSSGNGAIVMSVPADELVYDVDASSGNGAVDISVPTSDDAPRRIVAHSGNGAIAILSH